MVQDLGLTEDQVKKIRDADFTSREKRLALKVQLDSLRLEMDKAFSGDTIKDAAVLSLAQKISDVKGKMFVQGIESRLLLGKILNADQLEKLKLFKMQRKRKGRSHSRKHISRGNSGEEPTNASGTAN